MKSAFNFHGCFITVCSPGLLTMLLMLIGFTRLEGKMASYFSNTVTATVSIETHPPDTSTVDYDGPHIFYKAGSVIIKQVMKHDTGFYAISDTIADEVKGKAITCYVNDTLQFTTTLKKSLKNEPSIYPSPDKLIALSDIEGNFITFRDFLISNGVMNKDYTWTFGKGHLVLVGDFFDRGLHVTECLWLIYHLEQEAIKSKGYVHFILGNHEIMNMNGDVRYVRNKYFENSYLTGEAYINWFTPETELGRWLQTKNIVERIGSYLFVHGGISTELFSLNSSIEKLNEIARRYYYKESEALESNNKLIATIYSGDYSPFWYRGYTNGVMDMATLDQIFEKYDAGRIVVGHSIVEDVTYFYNKKVIAIDTKHSSGDSEGLRVEHGVEYRIDLTGKGYRIE